MLDAQPCRVGLCVCVCTCGASVYVCAEGVVCAYVHEWAVQCTHCLYNPYVRAHAGERRVIPTQEERRLRQ